MDLLKFFCPTGPYSAPVGVTQQPGGKAIYQVEHDVAARVFWQIKGTHGIPAQSQKHGYTDDAILLYGDNSTASGIPYAQRDDLKVPGAKWCARHQDVGDVTERNPYLLELDLATGEARTISQTPIRTWLKFAAHQRDWQSANGGPVIDEVIVLEWYLDAALTQLEETYVYGCDDELGALGLIEFRHRDQSAWPNHVWPALPPAELVPVMTRKPMPPDTVRVTPTTPVVTPPVVTPPPPAAAVPRTIRPDIYVNVRRGPSTATSIMETLPPSTRLYTVATVPSGDGDGFDWHERQTGGYIRADLFTDYAPPQPTVSLFKSPLTAAYSRGWEYRAGHSGEDLAVAANNDVRAGGVGQVAYVLDCPKCTDAKPNVGAYGIPLNSPSVLNDPAWAYGFGPSPVVRYDYPALPDSARAAMDALPGQPRYLYVIYAHMNSISVKPGQCVGPDTVLGKSGGKGNSDGNHLHVECRASIRGDETSLMSRATIDPDLVFAL